MSESLHETDLTSQRAASRRTARYAAGPSKGRSSTDASAPGVAEVPRHQGVPEGAGLAQSVQPPARAADEAAVRRIARRRRRDNVQRQERVDARYSKAEKAAITAKAVSMNIAAAHLVGDAVMAYVEGSQALPDHRSALDDWIDELAALRTQVSKVGTNVNQIAHRLNAGADAHPVDTAVLGQAGHTLDAVRAALATIDASADHAAGHKAA